MSNVAGRRDGMVNASDGAASYVLKKRRNETKTKTKKKKKVKQTRLSTVDSSIDYVYYKNLAGGEFIFPEFSSYVTPLSSLHFLPQLPIQVHYVIQGPPHKPRPRSEITLGKLCTNTHQHPFPPNTVTVPRPRRRGHLRFVLFRPLSAHTVSRSPCDRVPVAAAPSSANRPPSQFESHVSE